MPTGEGHVRFAARTGWAEEETAWSRALAERRAAGLRVLDLTASNPTHCGFRYADDLLDALAAEGARHYDPDPRGMAHARAAVARYYGDHGAPVDPDSIVLTTSTSEGYSWLFRLLCDPGDEVLIAQPSYPLFDLLATIDDVRLTPFPMLFDPAGDPGWHLDLYGLAQQVTPRTRAVILVHPNNPTGHYTAAAEREALIAFCRERELALIVDEVFLDYSWPGRGGTPHTFAGNESDALIFVLSGLSKVAALPQMKASWIICGGLEEQRREAMRRLEIIADTFLSMNAPVQHALPGWLVGRGAMQQQIRERVAANLAVLDDAIAEVHGMTRLAAEGGWYAVLRTPPSEDGDALATRLVTERGVAVHAGSFFGFAESNRLVISLLPELVVFRDGVREMLAAMPST